MVWAAIQSALLVVEACAQAACAISRPCRAFAGRQEPRNRALQPAMSAHRRWAPVLLAALLLLAVATGAAADARPKKHKSGAWLIGALLPS